MKKILSSIFLVSYFFIFLFSCSLASARTPAQITDWYIKDRQIEIQVNKDASLDITENILADCGTLPDKHGITYSVPTFYQLTLGEKVTMPINLTSITHGGENVKYSSSTDSGILTWKIGDPNIIVTGENDYVIKYKVSRAIRFGNPGFDEFYWNITGPFSTLEDDHLLAKITFPLEINDSNTALNGYSGKFGTKDAGAVTYQWTEKNILQIESKRTLKVGEGITTSITFPKGIISQPVLTFWEKYGDMIIGLILLLIPILVFLICFILWWKYGRDVSPGRAVAPEFAIPDDMNPMEMSVFLDNGKLKTSAISAAIVNLAVQGYIKIEAIPKQGLFSSADTKFIRTGKISSSLSDAEKNLIDYLFGSLNEVKLSDLKNQFYKHISSLKNACFSKLSSENLFEKKGFGMQTTMFVIGGLWAAGLFFAPVLISAPLFYVISIISIIILFIFGYLMPKRSKKGEELLWRIKGLKMYMMTAEKYRQKFNEKEGIFERFLPYAMLFGITDLWVSKIKQIYGEEYFNTYHPIWYVGYIGNFNIDDFSSQISALSSNMASTISSSPSSTGSGGGGFSGGGGGGGSVGGW